MKSLIVFDTSIACVLAAAGIAMALCPGE